MQVVGITHDHGSDSPLGSEYLLTDANHLVSIGHSNSGSFFSQFGQPRGPTLNGPSSTLVGSSSGFEIDLIWDSSVRSSANWAAIEAAVVTAAQIYTQAFSNHVVINIAVGLGEIGGSQMSSGALGESESYGYLTNYSTVAGALSTTDQGLISSHLMSFDALSANGPPTKANFFITSAEAKALGLVGSSSAIDGYIGISSSSSLIYFSGNGGTIGKSQYDAVGITAHEISEVMGRIGLEGGALGGYTNVYTPLDLFRYTAPGVRDLSASIGYFSTTDGAGGASNLNTYNNPQNGGDATDWASVGAANAVLNDAYDAFGTPGVITHVSSTDLLEVAALGFTLTSTGLTEITKNSSIVA